MELVHHFFSKIIIPIIVTLILAQLMALFSASHTPKMSFVITSSSDRTLRLNNSFVWVKSSESGALTNVPAGGDNAKIEQRLKGVW